MAPKARLHQDPRGNPGATRWVYFFPPSSSFSSSPSSSLLSLRSPPYQIMITPPGGASAEGMHTVSLVLVRSHHAAGAGLWVPPDGSRASSGDRDTGLRGQGWPGRLAAPRAQARPPRRRRGRQVQPGNASSEDTDGGMRSQGPTPPSSSPPRRTAVRRRHSIGTPPPTSASVFPAGSFRGIAQEPE